MLRSSGHGVDETDNRTLDRSRLESLIDVSPHLVFETDERGVLTFVNTRFYTVLGLDRERTEKGLMLVDLLTPDSQANVSLLLNRTLTGEGDLTARTTVRCPNGTTFPAMIHLRTDSGQHTPAFVQGALIKLTDRNRAEIECEEMNNADLIKQLAGGIGHDLTNMLSVLIGTATLLGEAGDIPESRKNQIKRIFDASNRGYAIARNLVSISHCHSYTTTVSLNSIAREVESLLESIVSERATIKLKLNGSLAHIEGNETRLEQMLMNLCLNAADAMEKKGTITITTDNVLVEQQFHFLDQIVLPGSYVIVEVKDDGCGIPSDILDKIFEPFFTTKTATQGTGVGLAAVKHTVKSLNGAVTVQSPAGQGTTFTVYLPTEDCLDKKTSQREPSTGKMMAD